MRHNAIVVVAQYDADGWWKPDIHWIEVAHAVAVAAFRGTTAVVTEPTGPGSLNNVRSFMVAPDGSKEGWDESDLADGARAAFREWLDGRAFEDGSSPLTWVEVAFGHHQDPDAVWHSSRDRR